MFTKPTILFVGSHLSHVRGTKGISEKIAGLLDNSYTIKLVSHFDNQFLRMLDIIFQVLFGRYDIAHIDVFSDRGFIYVDIAGKIAKLRSKKIVMSLRGGKLAEKLYNEPERVRKVLYRANVLQSPSLFLINAFKKSGINVSHMPNFIALDTFPFQRDEITPHSLLWVRGFNAGYRPELAVHTLQHLKTDFPDATLTMIGPDKGTLEQTKKLIKELGLDNDIVLVGKIDNNELYRYYQTHSIFLNTTTYESFGVAVLEAASCGIPIISTKVGELPNMWEENIEILMINNADPKDMAAKASEIFTSDTFAHKLSENAHKKALTYDWKNIYPKWIDLIDSLYSNVK